MAKKKLAKSLKNDGVRQLGFSEIPNNIWKVIKFNGSSHHHQPPKLCNITPISHNFNQLGSLRRWTGQAGLAVGGIPV